MLFLFCPPSLSFFLFPLFCSWSHSPPPSHGPPHLSGLFSLRFPSFSASLIFSASLFVTDSDELEGQASPLFVDLGLWDMAGVYIYFFSIVVVIIIINIIIMERFKQTEKRRSVAVAQDSAREQRYSKGEESSPSTCLPLFPPFPCFLHLSHHPTTTASSQRSRPPLTLPANPTLLLSVHLLSPFPTLTDNYVFYLEKFYSWHIQKWCIINC